MGNLATCGKGPTGQPLKRQHEKDEGPKGLNQRK